MKIAALAGGVGAAKLLSGLVEVMPPEDLTVIVNTGDDFRWDGLYVCPDIDTIVYTLAGIANPETGWGIRDDSFVCLERMGQLGCDTWFRIGDRDLATHLIRTEALEKGATLTEITADLCRRSGILVTVLPMTDSHVPTMLDTDEGMLEFQDYFVRRSCTPRVRAITYRGIDKCVPADGMLEALRSADSVIICPSNPYISIEPILAVPGIRDVLRAGRSGVVGVSPIIGGKAIKGPTAEMMRQLGDEVSPVGVAMIYKDILGTLVIATSDAAFAEQINSIGIKCVAEDILMDTHARRVALARLLLGMNAVK